MKSNNVLKTDSAKRQPRHANRVFLFKVRIYLVSFVIKTINENETGL